MPHQIRETHKVAECVDEKAGNKVSRPNEEKGRKDSKNCCVCELKKIKNFNRCVEAVIPYDLLKMTDQRRVLRLKLLLNSADIASNQ